MTNDEVWKLVMDNEPLLRREARRYLSRERSHEFEEMYSDVVYGRAHDIMRTFDPEKRVLPITHLCVSVRWYAHKWARYGDKWKRSAVLGLQGDDAGSYESDDSRLTVEHLLDRIPEDMAELIRWHVCKGYTFKEIADHLGKRSRDVKQDLEEAMDLLKDYAGVESTL